MSLDRILAVSGRIARQIIKDRRSIALIVLAPVLVMTLVGFSLFDAKAILNRITPALLGVFVLFPTTLVFVGLLNLQP